MVLFSIAMDSPRRTTLLPAFSLFVLAILLPRFPVAVQGYTAFRVKRKFSAGTPTADLIRHDELRHARRLSARPLDVHIGGGLFVGLYYTDILIGKPPSRLQVHIDTGSPVTWFDCTDCIDCPKPNGTVKMATYNPKLSQTARIVMGNERLCDELYSGATSDMPRSSPNGFCNFQVEYLDGSSVHGYYVTDFVSFNQVSSNPSTGLANITFGCITEKHEPKPKPGTEGLMGLSWSKHSILSQMASLGRVRKEFAHCLDDQGGIFAIGHVVKPKVTTMTPLLQKGYGLYYEISVTAIEVGSHSHIHQYAVTVDTGATLMCLPKAAFDFTMEKIYLKHPNLRKEAEKNNGEFSFTGSVDAEFPTINIQINMSHALKLYPHDYLLQDKEKNNHTWFNAVQYVGDEFILGDVALRNRLFIYDLENMQLGWQDYNCSSSIELEDEAGVCNIGAHNMSAYPD